MHFHCWRRPARQLPCSHASPRLRCCSFGLHNPKVVFTIHNLNYGQKKLAEAAQYSQKFTTVRRAPGCGSAAASSHSCHSGGHCKQAVASCCLCSCLL
jgi:hypothetical protein